VGNALLYIMCIERRESLTQVSEQVSNGCVKFGFNDIKSLYLYEKYFRAKTITITSAYIILLNIYFDNIIVIKVISFTISHYYNSRLNSFLKTITFENFIMCIK